MANTIKNSIKQGAVLLSDPTQGFANLKKQTLEEVVGNYLKLLLLLSFVAALFNFVIGLVRTVYFDLTRTVQIDYPAFLNYLISESFAYVFVYFLSGTFILLIVSAIAYRFFRKHKYTEFLKIMLYSAYPIILFGWIPFLAITLIVWSIFLFAVGIRGKRSHGISRGSLEERE
ncbi:MAG: hypothetical protein KJ601_02250 [Nanoarchaeota archaeon]|nr:hypothetical protein [Nanoarchaeota archaeon]MBU1704789.1 hypothetical protein [Nanoarchaeota archaeon]